MHLLYANPLTLALHYLVLMFTGTPVDKLMQEFYEGVDNSFKGAQKTDNQIYDFIVVGAGSTGAALAGRLSENGNFSVLLIEAGSFPFPLTAVPALCIAPGIIYNPRMNWLDIIEPQKNAYLSMDQGKPKYQRPRVVGGGSALNLLAFMRGSPKDYERWANATGCPSWRYKNILKYFKKLENYRGPYEREEYHSNNGPMHAELPPDHLPLSSEYIQAGKELGYPEVDPNGYQTEGVYRYVTSTKNGRRWSTNDAYVYPALLRPNFQIEINSEVTQILLSAGNVAEGVVYTKKNKTYTARARKEVILSAGVMGSPKILMLSGIGPKDHLSSVGIPVKVNLPAVGQNMQDHLMLFFGPFIYNRTKSSAAGTSTTFDLKAVQDFIIHGRGPLSNIGTPTGGHFRSSFAEPGHPDLINVQMAIDVGDASASSLQSLLATRPGVMQAYMKNDYGSSAFFLNVVNVLPKSLGELKLRSSNPFDPLIVDPKYFTHEQDIKTVVEGLKLSLKFVETEPYRNIDAHLTNTPFPGCEAYAGNSYSDDYLTCYARHMTVSQWHYSCTCAMGRPPASPNEIPTSVVDSKFRVHGVKGLRIADASVFPFVINANSNIPCIMIGEKLAEELQQEWSA